MALIFTAECYDAEGKIQYKCFMFISEVTEHNAMAVDAINETSPTLKGTGSSNDDRPLFDLQSIFSVQE